MRIWVDPWPRSVGWGSGTAVCCGVGWQRQLNLTSSLGTSTCCGCSPKKQKKKDMLDVKILVSLWSRETEKTKIKKKATWSSYWGIVGLISRAVQQVKDPVLPQLWHRLQLGLGFNPWSKNFHMLRKRPEKKERKKGGKKGRKPATNMEQRLDSKVFF